MYLVTPSLMVFLKSAHNYSTFILWWSTSASLASIWLFRFHYSALLYIMIFRGTNFLCWRLVKIPSMAHHHGHLSHLLFYTNWRVGVCWWLSSQMCFRFWCCLLRFALNQLHLGPWTDGVHKDSTNGVFCFKIFSFQFQPGKLKSPPRIIFWWRLSKSSLRCIFKLGIVVLSETSGR